jgi:hypothetical protein
MTWGFSPLVSCRAFQSFRVSVAPRECMRFVVGFQGDVARTTAGVLMLRSRCHAVKAKLSCCLSCCRGRAVMLSCCQGRAAVMLSCCQGRAVMLSRSCCHAVCHAFEIVLSCCHAYWILLRKMLDAARRFAIASNLRFAVFWPTFYVLLPYCYDFAWCCYSTSAMLGAA